MKAILAGFFYSLIISVTVHAQDQDHKKEILDFQTELNHEFSNPDESPLKARDLKRFKSLDFFPIDEKYRVEAKFVRSDKGLPFQMPTTTDRKPIYEKYGELHFDLEGESYVLSIYQSHRLREMEEFENYLFLPFTDLTNGKSTYGGGRFMDLEIPEGDTIMLDFNKAYNPYCAYNGKYSCPIPPKENDLPLAIEAGVKKFHD
ncbi:DUF1684 domain-containing protein [Echinicola marina]|uniref:DUF1684 domain-containing protein n=1 Tax=Echinicola marina TaxID=2859768 RepID=UPI001CF6EFAC|nr:DUF1684 domain-containing protein [Echinicola marina]UCS94564.1 DUF1684 domain-containing protein [Echinicola marina]